MKRAEFLKLSFGAGFLLAIAPHVAISNPKFCKEYQALYDGCIEKPDIEIAIKQNQLVVDLKENGIWDKLDSFCVPSNEIGHNINWRNP